jgi:hypothetical protein
LSYKKSELSRRQIFLEKNKGLSESSKRADGENPHFSPRLDRRGVDF